MKHIKLLMVLCLIALGTVSCDKDFEEINTNPNDPTTVPAGLMLVNIASSIQNISYSTGVGGDMGACWAQHWGKVQYNDEARYIPRTGTVSAVWSSLYSNVVADAEVMQELAAAEGNSNLQGVALVLRAYAFAFLADTYGDIPFEEANKGKEGNFLPKYDAQENVYNGILALLDEADAKLNGEGAITATSDIVYGGDYMQWKKFANSLKFRVLMRISSKRDVSADLAALMAKPMFESNADEASLKYLPAAPNANPVYETVVEGSRAEFKIGEALVEKLQTLSDPRLEVYAQPNDAGAYRGKPAGYRNLPSDDYNYANVSAIGTKYLDAELPGVFLSYAELQFLMAEAAQKGYISGDASTYYENGVVASFEYNGVGGAANYLANGNISLSTGNELEKIATQKWISLFGQGHEAWTEWRRTKFPTLSPAVQGDLDEIPSRFTYPAIEASVNKSNYEAANAAQGADLLTTKIWWLK